MDDGNLGESIDKHASAVDDSLPAEFRFQNDDAHLEPSRWWFASSAFPMVAGTLGPVASAFSICALVRPWRQHYVPGTDVQAAAFLEDPPWLTVVNAIQLAMAVISNVFLLLNMARRVRFIIAQPVTIIGWYISAICLIALLGTGAGPLATNVPNNVPRGEIIWSQAFWYGVWAAILYFIVASLMVVTFWGAWSGHYPRDFRLTTSQRTLMLQTIMFLMYLLVGALIFSEIEGWNYLDGVYWADVTLFTVGFGDFTMSKTLSRALLFPYAFIGVISVGLVIGSIRSMVLERGKRQLDARIEEKRRRRTIRTMTRRGRDGILEPLEHAHSAPPFPMDEDEDNYNSQMGWPEYARRRKEFQLMRQIQERANTRRRWAAMSISTGVFVLLWTIGAAIFMQAEKDYQPWNYFDGFYFCFVSLTTIGYGDVTPVSPCGKSFFVFWSLLSLPTMTILISNAGDTVVAYVRDSTIRLGHITILPGDDPFRNSLRHILHNLTFGLAFEEPRQKEKVEHSASTYRHHRRRRSERHSPGRREQERAGLEKEKLSQSRDIEEQDDEGQEAFLPPIPPSAVAYRNRRTDDDDESVDNRGRSAFLDPESGLGSAPNNERDASTYTSMVRRSLSRLRDPMEELPVGTDFHFLLISEIKEVSKHLKRKESKQYSYDQWAWYLRLIGEDERRPDTHRKPKVKEDKTRIPDLGKLDKNDDRLKWSWVGNRSPLSGSQDESEWILDRLTDRLRECLSHERRKQIRQQSGWHHLVNEKSPGGHLPAGHMGGTETPEVVIDDVDKSDLSKGS